MKRAVSEARSWSRWAPAVALVLCACGGGNQDEPAGPTGDIQVDLFSTLLGKSDAEVEDKVGTAVNRFFGIGTDEPDTLDAANGYRCYHELPQDPSLAFIWAPDSNDIRSEGMSYGMILAVQRDLHEQFDRLWKFAKTYMQFADDTSVSAWADYFRWQGRVDPADPMNWAITFGDTTSPAPDGDQYFAAALYLAAQRWGSSGDVNYQAEAERITSAMLHNQPTQKQSMMDSDRYPIVHATENMVTFVPIGNANDFTDPSYHLPAFYELFARFGPAEDSAAWRSVAETSRAYLVRSAHAGTGLHPDYAGFDGTPVAGNNGQMQGHDSFGYDAWRVVMNMAVDYVWFSQDQRMSRQVTKYHEFFSSRISDSNVQNALYHLDGSSPSGGGSTALTATLAAGSLATLDKDRTHFVSNLWNVSQQQGMYRYYQEGVYLLGLLNTAGQFRYRWQ
ncbi:MAG TPA: glycosyl hydrolase family 8 [Polyangiaceae bacterium]|nr:glycosyl hydrolase family 8 [Polyangiaceae bacterium]